MAVLGASGVEGAVPVVSNGGGGGSLRDRLRQRREDLQRDRTFELPVNGYADIGVWARYRVLPYEVLRRIGENNKRMEGSAEGELAVAADTLINACVELLEKRDDGTFQSLGVSWGVEAARDVFAVTTLPEEATARNALYEIFTGPSGTTSMMLHFAAYDAELQESVPEDDEEMRGEYEASSASR